MSWQVCPLCKGNGFVYGYGYSSSAICHICHGKKIINEQTGLPPNELKVIDEKA